MMQLSRKMMIHQSVTTSSLRIKILKIDKFGPFSCDNDYNSKTDIFRNVFSFIINHCDPKQANRACIVYKYTLIEF